MRIGPCSLMSSQQKTRNSKHSYLKGVVMKMIKKISTIALLASSFSGTAMASSSTDAQFNKLVAKYGVTPRDQQAYCFTDAKGAFQGVNVDKKMRIASVSKVITSLWAVDRLGPGHTYDTKFYVKGDQMHIMGAFDPFMSNEKMIYIISSLNKLGITHLSKITFDNNIRIYPNAQFHSESWPEFTPEYNKQRLQLYFNTNSWTTTLQADYKKYSSLAPVGRYVDNPTFSVDTIEHSEINPLNLLGPVFPADFRVLTLKSPQLYKYLKEINVKSNNYAAQTVFEALGGASAFKAYAKSTFSFDEDQIEMFTGSGLPDYTTGPRRDNLATCRTVGTLVESLKEELERKNSEIEDVIAVPGSDEGTFKNRLNSEDLKNTFVAKTGTLTHVSTLAGALNTKKGYSFFGVFNASENIYGSKALQNDMVRILFDEMGGTKNFNYKVEGFLPYDKDAPLKSFLDEEEETNFSEIDGEMIIQ